MPVGDGYGSEHPGPIDRERDRNKAIKILSRLGYIKDEDLVNPDLLDAKLRFIKRFESPSFKLEDSLISDEFAASLDL